MSDALEQVRRRYLATNGEHPMSESDDRYVRAHFRPATGEELDLMVAGTVPLPSYLLSDGTPMVPDEHVRMLTEAGDPAALHAWFVGHWPIDERQAAEDEWTAYLSGQYVCLREVGPAQIRAKTAHTRQMDAAAHRLAETPDDRRARATLAEAMAGLEGLMLPQTTYDDARFGGGEGTWARLQRLRSELDVPHTSG